MERKIKKDFTDELEKKISQNRIANSVSITYLSDKRAIKINNLLINYKRLIEEINSKNIKEKDLTKKQKKEKKKFNKFIKKYNYSFYLWGEADEKDLDYKLSLNGFVPHVLLNPVGKNIIEKELNDIFLQNLIIDKKVQRKAFVFSAQHFSFVIRYIVGIVAIPSRKYELSRDLHMDLLKEIEINSKLPSNILNLKVRVKDFLVQSLYTESKEIEVKNSKKSLDLLNQAIVYDPENFFILDSKCCLEFVNNRDITESLRCADLSSKFSKDSLTWAYNKAFLLMYDEKFKLALKVYRKIFNNTFSGESGIIEDVVNFNKNLFKKEPDKYQCLFMNGYLLSKKYTPIKGYTYLKDFVEKTKRQPKFVDLNNIAKTYIRKAEKIINNK